MRAKKAASEPSALDLVAEIAKLVAQIESLPPDLSAARKRKAVAALDLLARQVSDLAGRRDSTIRPTSVFDPGNPLTAGRIVALTLLAQPRVRIASIREFYGSGVYAVYYNGPFKDYKPLKDTEHPIYIGKADPASGSAVTAIEQGTKLYNRLREHNQKSIERASNLKVEDFHCRFLVVQSGYQAAAEDYLIKFFRPVWNKEAQGIGKHGDHPETRANKRSKWDTLHPGRDWAEATKEDQRSKLAIQEKLKEHFESRTIYRRFDDILKEFIQEMAQVNLDEEE